MLFILMPLLLSDSTKSSATAAAAKIDPSKNPLQILQLMQLQMRNDEQCCSEVPLKQCCYIYYNCANVTDAAAANTAFSKIF
jgi:hypothetical protein